MWIIQGPKKVALWNKRHFEEEKRRVCCMFKIFSTYICSINKKMQRLEVSCAVRPLKWPLGVKWLIRHAMFLRYRHGNSDNENIMSGSPWYRTCWHSLGPTEKRPVYKTWISETTVSRIVRDKLILFSERGIYVESWGKKFSYLSSPLYTRYATYIYTPSLKRAT
jgi:hypothetical protein